MICENKKKTRARRGKQHQYEDIAMMRSDDPKWSFISYYLMIRTEARAPDDWKILLFVALFYHHHCFPHI